jgi:hypothetical protein
MRPGIEVHVGIELAADEVLVLQRDAFELERDFEQRVLARDLEHFVGRLLDDLGARVVRLVDPVAEAHRGGLRRLDALDEVGDVLHAADLVQHAADRLVGAAVERAIEAAAAPAIAE